MLAFHEPRAFEHDGRRYLITDTVGFIRRLPHQLVEGFASTLEETLVADLLLHVLDASVDDDEQEEQNAATLFYDTLMEKAEIGEVAGDTFATFLDVLHLTPRSEPPFLCFILCGSAVHQFANFRVPAQRPL